VKLYETAKTISLTSHFIAFLGLSMNADYFAKLPKDIQTILLEEAAKAAITWRNSPRSARRRSSRTSRRKA
jgi:TRAP-type C4-dicarboxylate transport system substrate-binding protein